MEFSVVLIEPLNAGNVGAIARSMKNFGFSSLVIVNPKCDWSGDDARNRAKHAQSVLDGARLMSMKEVFEEFNLVVATSGVTGNHFNVPRSPILASELKNVLKGDGKVAILFGREDDGLSNEEVQKCDFLVNIPSSKEYPILNLSHSVAIILYELSNIDFGKVVREDHVLLDSDDKSRLLNIVDSLIDKTEFSTDNERDTQRKVWKRLIGKGILTKREAYSLMGFLKKLN